MQIITISLQYLIIKHNIISVNTFYFLISTRTVIISTKCKMIMRT